MIHDIGFTVFSSSCGCFKAEAFLPFSWRLGQLEFHIENEFAEAGPDVGIRVGISSLHPER